MFRAYFLLGEKTMSVYVFFILFYLLIKKHHTVKITTFMSEVRFYTGPESPIRLPSLGLAGLGQQRSGFDSTQDVPFRQYPSSPRREYSGSFRDTSLGNLGRSIVRIPSTVVSVIDDHIAVGTVSGTALNATCNIMGAGVLALPLATYHASVVGMTTLLCVMVSISFFSTYIVSHACHKYGRYSLGQLLACSIVGLPTLPSWASYDDMPGETSDSANPAASTSDGESPVMQRADSQSISGAVSPASLPPAGEPLSQGNFSYTNFVPTKLKSSLKKGSGIDLTVINNDINSSISRDRFFASSAADETNTLPSLAEEQRRSKQRLFLVAFVDALIFLYNFGLLVVYSVVIADSVPDVMQNVLGTTDGLLASKRFWYILPALVFFGLSCTRSMSELKWSSILGVATIVNITVCICVRYFEGTFRYYGLTGELEHTTQNAHHMRITHIHSSREVIQAVAALSTAFSFQYNVPIFYGELGEQTPGNMMKSVSIAFPFVAISYLITGLLGYASFGPAVADRFAGGNIVNNYPSTDFLLNIARFGLFLHLLCVYPLVSISVRHGIHRLGLIMIGRSAQAINPDTVRTTPMHMIIVEAWLIVCGSVSVAAALGEIGSVIDVIGTLCGATISCSIPAVIGIAMWRPQSKKQAESERKRRVKKKSLDRDITHIAMSESRQMLCEGLGLDTGLEETGSFCFGLIPRRLSVKTLYELCWVQLVIGLTLGVGGFFFLWFTSLYPPVEQIAPIDAGVMSNKLQHNSTMNRRLPKNDSYPKNQPILDKKLSFPQWRRHKASTKEQTSKE